MDAARASPVSARMAVSREQDDHPLVPRSVTTAAPDATAACQSLSLRTRWTQQLFSRTHPAGDPAGSGTGALVSLAPPGPRLVMRPAPLMAPRRLQSVDTCMPTSAPTPPERLPLRTITALQTRRNRLLCAKSLLLRLVGSGRAPKSHSVCRSGVVATACVIIGPWSGITDGGQCSDR